MLTLVPKPQRPRSCGPSLLTALIPAPLLALAFFLLAASAAYAQTARPAIRKVPPVYPQIAKQAGVTGTVVVMATVDPTGKVIKAEVTSGNKMLGTSATDAVKQWKFAPGTGTDILIVSVDFAKQP